MRKTYYMLELDNYNQPSGTIKSVELTRDEFLKIKEKRGYIYENEYHAALRAQS